MGMRKANQFSIFSLSIAQHEMVNFNQFIFSVLLDYCLKYCKNTPDVFFKNKPKMSENALKINLLYFSMIILEVHIFTHITDMETFTRTCRYLYAICLTKHFC